MDKDSYFVELCSIADEVEKAYSLQGTDNLKDKEIDSVVNVVMQKVKVLDKQTRFTCNEKAGKQIVVLSYLSHRLQYYELRKLDYKQYPFKKKIAEILLLYCNRQSVDAAAISKVLDVVTVLKAMDTKSPKYKYSLGYRYLRILVVLILMGSYYNASIVATFVIEQMILQE